MPSTLIIDDQPESLLKLSEIARGFGFRVATARDLKSARAALAKRLTDAAILNIHIGGVNSPLAGRPEALVSRAHILLESVVSRRPRSE